MNAEGRAPLMTAPLHTSCALALPFRTPPARRSDARGETLSVACESIGWLRAGTAKVHRVAHRDAYPKIPAATGSPYPDHCPVCLPPWHVRVHERTSRPLLSLKNAFSRSRDLPWRRITSSPAPNIWGARCWCEPKKISGRMKISGRFGAGADLTTFMSGGMVTRLDTASSMRVSCRGRCKTRRRNPLRPKLSDCSRLPVLPVRPTWTETC